MTKPIKAQDAYGRIWAVVKKIPPGRVATYGQVAAAAGFAKQPRMAGYAMHNLPVGTKIPWHRVINAQGRISFPVDSEGWRRQKQCLEAEGVLFINGRVDLKRQRWQPQGSAPILD
jgi:methylated-DNA-protein-cysteine methyltransferase-like protein